LNDFEKQLDIQNSISEKLKGLFLKEYEEASEACCGGGD
jgi:hypothetical protein